MEELRRFFNSINYKYNDKFKNTYINKVVFNRDTKIYRVYLQSEEVIDYDVMHDLFLHRKDGINGSAKCFI